MHRYACGTTTRRRTNYPGERGKAPDSPQKPNQTLRRCNLFKWSLAPAWGQAHERGVRRAPLSGAPAVRPVLVVLREPARLATGTGLPAAPAASRFSDRFRRRCGPTKPPRLRGKGAVSASVSSGGQNALHGNACRAIALLSLPSLRSACLSAPAAPGAGGAARGTPKIGSSQGLSRDFRQSPSSRVPGPLYPLETLPDSEAI